MSGSAVDSPKGRVCLTFSFPAVNETLGPVLLGYEASSSSSSSSVFKFPIDTFSAQRIYQSMIMPIFTYCGYSSLGWSESRKRMIRSIEKRSLEIISPKCSPQNFDLRFLTIDNFLQKKACCLVFDCLNGTACSPFKNYFQRLNHTLETMGKQQNCPRSNWILRAVVFIF